MDKKEMTQSEMLAAIADAVRRRQAGEDPMSDPRLKAILPKQEMPMPNVNPPRVDPEAQASAAVDAAVGPSRPANIRLMMERLKGNPINPETGMPHYNPPAAEAEAPNPQEEERRQIRMQLLKEAAQTGKMPDYLKKY